MKLIFMLFLTLVEVITAYSDKDHNIRIETKQFSNYRIGHHLFELMRELIRNGNVTKGIPVLDPYEFDYKTAEFNGMIYSATANITSAVISGASSFYLERSDFNNSDMSIEVNILFPLLNVLAVNYELIGNILGILPLTGRGLLDIEVQNTTFLGKIYLKQSKNDKSILIEKIEEPLFYVGHIISRTEFDKNSDDIINAIINDLAADYLNRFNRYIALTYIETIVYALNHNILEKLESWHIIDDRL